MRIEHSCPIAAEPEVVWALTEDVESWPSMTPTMKSVERLDDGPIRVGSTARVVQPGQRPTVWTVGAIEPGRVFEWSARVMGMSMVARHVIEPAPRGCVNTLILEITGGASSVLGRVLGRRLRAVLETENAGFKSRAESLNVV